MKQKHVRIDERTRTATTPDGKKIPVVDGKFTFPCSPSDEDKRNGIPGDHANCMYCYNIRRTHGSTLVWITRWRAYIEFWVKGGSELQRYIVKLPAQMNIRDFDAGKDVLPETIFFVAPSGSLTLDAMAEARLRRRFAKKNGQTKEPKKEAYVKGTISGKKSRQKKTIQSKTMGLRSRASGMFHFKQAA